MMDPRPDEKRTAAAGCGGKAVFHGVGAGRGIAHGRLSFRTARHGAAGNGTTRQSTLTPEAERARFEKARGAARDHVSELTERAAAAAGEEAAAIFEIHGMLLDDEDFISAALEGIAGGLTAEAAAALEDTLRRAFENERE